MRQHLCILNTNSPPEAIVPKPAWLHEHRLARSHIAWSAYALLGGFGISRLVRRVVYSSSSAFQFRFLKQLRILPWVEPRPEPMTSAMALKWSGCQVLSPPHRASGAPTATRSLPGRVKGVPSWGHGFGATSSESNSAGSTLDVALALLNSGIPDIRPSPATGEPACRMHSTPSPRPSLL